MPLSCAKVPSPYSLSTYYLPDLSVVLLLDVCLVVLGVGTATSADDVLIRLVHLLGYALFALLPHSTHLLTFPSARWA